MNFFGIATGTDTYALSVSERSELRPGDIVTVVFLHDNTGASTLNVNGFGPVPLLRNASAMSAGDLVASTTYQFCYTGASFVQDVQASAGATTDASLLTSGTLAAARLPSNINAANLADGSVSNTELQYINSVTSNVQSQLDNKAALSHSHAASDITSGTIATARLGSGTADSTTFLCGDQTYKTVSATDNTKLPTDGSGSMTGPMIHSADGTATSSNYEIVRITNKYVRNVPSGKAISDRVNGVEMLGLDGNGDTFSIGRVDDGYSYVVGNYGNNYYNCPYGGTHLFRVNGAVIGHFPLTPSDMPSQVAKYSRTTSNQGSLSGSYVANTIGLNSVDSNIGTNWSFSGGVATCLNAGVYDLVAQLGYSSQEGGFVINHNGNAIGVYYYYSANNLLFGSINIPEVSVGAGDTIKLEFFSSAATGVIYYTYTGFPTTVPDKHATWLRMTRRQ